MLLGATDPVHRSLVSRCGARPMSRHGFPCIGVIADDLAGATVAATALASAGVRTVVVSQEWPTPGDQPTGAQPDWPAAAEALVVNIGSRELAIDGRLSVNTVPELVGSAARRLRTLRCSRIELRVDGALRRDYSADLDAALVGARLSNPLVLAVPAYPSAGRWTSGGHQIVVVPGSEEQDILVSDRLFAGHSSAVIAETTVVSGPEAIAACVRAQSQAARRFVVDAKNEVHLRHAAGAAAILEAEFGLMTVSSGGWLPYHPASLQPPGFILVAMGLPTTPNEIQLQELLAHSRSRLMLVEEAVQLSVNPEAFLRCAGDAEVIIVKAAGDPVTDATRLVAAQRVADAVQAILAASQRDGVRCHGVIGAGAFTAARVAVALGGANILPMMQTEPAIPIGVLSGGSGRGCHSLSKPAWWADHAH